MAVLDPAVMSLTFAGKFAGLLADVLIAARLGTGRTADALFVALTLLATWNLESGVAM